VGRLKFFRKPKPFEHSVLGWAGRIAETWKDNPAMRKNIEKYIYDIMECYDMDLSETDVAGIGAVRESQREKAFRMSWKILADNYDDLKTWANGFIKQGKAEHPLLSRAKAV
jgi:hypothetical protein